MNVAICRSSCQLKAEDEVVNACDSRTDGCSGRSCNMWWLLYYLTVVAEMSLQLNNCIHLETTRCILSMCFLVLLVS